MTERKYADVWLDPEEDPRVGGPVAAVGRSRCARSWFT